MLSIIIPTLNEEKYLPILLSQIKKQRFSDLEIIVADAGSQDKTIEIAKNFSCKITQGGLPAKGRNEGAKVAGGDILLFMDADNIYLPEGFLKDVLDKFEKRKLDVAFFSFSVAGNNFDKFTFKVYNYWIELTQSFLAHSVNSVLIRKDIHQKIGGFDEEIKLAEDYEYSKRAAKIGKFGFIKTEPVLTSPRRFERDGRFKTYLKYIMAGVYMFFLGPIKSDIFKYRFGDFADSKSKDS